MALLLKLCFLCVVFCYVGLVKSASNVSRYSTEVEGLFKDLTDYKGNVNIAKQKMNTFPGETLDRKYAIAMINLYTQESSFYKTLTYQMRNNYPDTSTDIWRRAGKLIDKAFDILGPKIYEKVYRGCSKLDTLPILGQTYAFNQVISTSLNMGTAVGFIRCSNGKLFEIDNVYGVSVEKYSAFKSEREIIVKSTNIFLVKAGPEPVAHYDIWYLDGQPQANKVQTTTTPKAISQIMITTETKMGGVSGVIKPEAGFTSTYVFVLVLVLSMS